MFVLSGSKDKNVGLDISFHSVWRPSPFFWKAKASCREVPYCHEGPSFGSPIYGYINVPYANSISVVVVAGYLMVPYLLKVPVCKMQ